MAGIVDRTDAVWPGSPKQIVVVDEMMVSDISKFCLAGAGKLKDDSIGSINPKAPDFMMLGVQLLGPERGMKGIFFKDVCSRGGFVLNILRQVLEEPIERGGRRNFDHARLVDQFPQGFSFRHPSGAVIPLRSLQRLQKLRPVEPD